MDKNDRRTKNSDWKFWFAIAHEIDSVSWIFLTITVANTIFNWIKPIEYKTISTFGVILATFMLLVTTVFASVQAGREARYQQRGSNVIKLMIVSGLIIILGGIATCAFCYTVMVFSLKIEAIIAAALIFALGHYIGRRMSKTALEC